MADPGDGRVNILLVDDQPAELAALEATLERLDQNLVRAQGGREALRVLLQQDFAVILLDVMMPQPDGFETARLIRERDRSARTPIIFLTGLQQGELPLFRAYSLGAVDYLVKPFEPEILRSKVSVFVDLAMKTQQMRRALEALAEAQRRQHEQDLPGGPSALAGGDLRGDAHAARPARSPLPPGAHRQPGGSDDRGGRPGPGGRAPADPQAQRRSRPAPSRGRAARRPGNTGRAPGRRAGQLRDFQPVRAPCWRTRTGWRPCTATPRPCS